MDPDVFKMTMIIAKHNHAICMAMQKYLYPSHDFGFK